MAFSIEEAKVVLITDGISDVGSATSRLFAKQGYKIAIVGSNKELTDKVARDCIAVSPFNYQVLTLVIDLSDVINGAAIVEQTVDHYGRLDVLINNAALNQKARAADKSSFDLYRSTLSFNVDSVVKASMEAVPHLEKNSGSIVFAMVAGSTKQQANNYAYLMSVVALTSYAKCLALDVAPKIRVNILNGGCGSGLPDLTKKKSTNVDNSFNDVEKEKIVGTIFYLASDEAAFVNGAEFYHERGNIHMSTDSV